MANAKVCDNCRKVIDDINISINGYKLEMKEKLEYGINFVENFCSFNCFSEYMKKQQELLEDILKLKNKKEEEMIKMSDKKADIERIKAINERILAYEEILEE